MGLKFLFIADGVITPEELVACTGELAGMGVQVDVALDRIGESREEIAQYITQMEKGDAEFATVSDEVLEKVRDADAVIAHFSVINQAVIDAGSKLKLIGVLRSGVENVNLKAAAARGIPVVSSPGRVAGAVADYTIAMMIAENRNIVRSNLIGTQGDWKIRFFNYPYSHNMGGKTVGIIGFGEIGRQVAKRAVAFDTKVVIYDPFVSNEDIEAAGYTPVDEETLFRTADYVSIHVRLSDKTRHMIGAKQLAMMKPTATLVNTARAGLIDEAALVEALQRKAIGGAALDVFEQEPIDKNHPLLQLENVTLTPHLAGTISNLTENSVAVLMRDLRRFIAGEPLQNIQA